jgi:transcriptional antiterminator RfaH
LTETPWYVVHTHAHSESKAASNLSRQGYSIYLPLYLKKRRHARRVETVAAPFFPRYLFIRVDWKTQGWRPIQSTIGVRRLVCHGDEPASLSNRVVAELRNREDEHGYIRFDPRPRFAPGDQVRVINGAFDTCLGLFEGMKDRERVAILLDLLGRKVRVLLERDAIAAA